MSENKDEVAEKAAENKEDKTGQVIDGGSSLLAGAAADEPKDQKKAETEKKSESDSFQNESLQIADTGIRSACREPNMGLEEIFTCQVCFMPYDDGSKDKKDSEGGRLMYKRKPYLVPCGHTFC